MTSMPENSQKTVYIEYCRSCDTHNWCTHHDQTKYHHTFLKLSELLAQHFPDIEVIGNMVPPHLIPFKISENKYIDSQTNKYVVYPQIGSFQVRFNNATIYSKKDNNAWPNLAFIVSKIGSIMDPNYNSPPKIRKSLHSSKKEEEINVEKQEQNNRFLKLEDEKMKVYKDQSKGFTLTDHFKLYRQKAKHEDKEWLTEKQESQGSIKQFSQQFRGQSRQKSEKSQDQKRRRDFNGQTKLKQMLKSRGLMLKQQGKKEMIVKLDSIEEENANYEQGYGATQRTQEITSKKNKMQDLEDEFSSLQNRFKSFENRVHDIHTKKRQFQYKQQPSNQQSRLKNGQVKNEEFARKQSKKQQVAQKENFYFYQRANRLDQYLNASEEEKNQKLHKIYGEWKYLKQTAQKNKKLLKNKRRNSQEQHSSEQQSQTNSNSSSYITNVITFKPKIDKSTPKLFQNIKNLSKDKGHKYSTLEKYDSNKTLVTEPKFRTGEHFYNRNMKNQQHLSTENEQQLVHNSGKLLKKTLGNMSLQALKNHGSKEALINVQKPNREELSQFSESAQNNIRQIQSRITKIQNKLKAQKENQETPSIGKSTFDAIKNVYSNKKSRSGSQASDYNAKNDSKREAQNKSNNKNNQNTFRNSYRNSNQKNLRHVAKPKADHKGKASISQTPSNDYKKQGASHSEAIQQESELLDSNSPSFTELRQDIKNNDQHHNRSINKKNSPNNHRLKSKQRANRESTHNMGISTFTKNQQKVLKSESNQSFNVSQPKKIKNGKQSFYDEERISKMETDVTQNNEQYYERSQKQSRIRDHQLNQQVTYLRKKKEWRQSQPVKKSKKQRHLRQSEEEQISRSQQQEDNFIEQSQETSKLRESKHTVFKAKNQMKPIQRQNSNTPKKSKNKHSNQPEFSQQRQKTQFGCIRKNKSRQNDAFRSIEKQQQDRERQGFQAQQMRAENDEEIEYEQQDGEKSEVEGQMEDYYGQLPENQSVESNPYILQHEKSANHEQKESKPLQKKICSKSLKSRIKKANRKQNLSYYKSEQVCFQGGKKQNTVSNHESSLHSENAQTNDLQRKMSFHEQASGRSIQNGVSGWKFNSEQEGYSDQIIIDAEEQSAKNHEEEAEFEQQENSKLRNSLDMELENDEQQLSKQKQSEAKKQQQEQAGSNKVTADQNQRRLQNSQQNYGWKQKQRELIQKQAAAINPKQKSMKAKQKTKATTIIKTQLQPQSLITKQYSQYLTQKLANALIKQTYKVEPTKTQTKQTTSYQDCEIAINLIICPSLSSIASLQPVPTVPASFIDYQPTAQQQTTEQQCADEESEQLQGDDQQNAGQIQQQKVQANQAVSLSKEVEDYVNAVNRSVIASICSNTVHNQQATEVHPLSNIGQAKKEPTSIPSEISKQQHSASPALSHIKQSTTPTKYNSSKFQQENNVYTQAKEVNKYKQIGIQKELTIEASIQTDHPPQDLSADLFMVRANSGKSNQVHNPPTSRQSHNCRVQMAETIFQDNNPFKNNYFSESKQESLFQKKKPAKQVERAHIIDKIYSQNVQLQAKKFTNLVAGQDIQKEQGAATKMLDFYSQGELFSPKGIEPELISTKFTRLLKVVQILCEKSEWLITRLFQDKNGILKEKGFGVWLCQKYQWESIIVDDAILVNEENHPLYSFHRGYQLWFNVLEKAVAIALGGYENLVRAETGQLFTMLTGCNAITSKIKQDPTKNNKLLLLINDCLRKNYVIHAQKSDKSKKESKESIYYVNSIRKAGGDEETLIEMSLNDRQSFWIKLSKFVTEFCKIEILQLRINHNFTHLDLGVGRPGQLTVVQLEFQEQAQGCVTLSYLGESGALRAFLYRQQKNKVLKLIGQAKQKNKSHLFFECSFTEGRYYVFAQAEQRPARLAFLGESHPRLTITEQIHSQGLKNEMAEYLPVRQNDDPRKKRSEMDSQLQWRGRMPRLQDNFVQSRLRENFISYVLGKTKY